MSTGIIVSNQCPLFPIIMNVVSGGSRHHDSFQSPALYHCQQQAVNERYVALTQPLSAARAAASRNRWESNDSNGSRASSSKQHMPASTAASAHFIANERYTISIPRSRASCTLSPARQELSTMRTLFPLLTLYPVSTLYALFTLRPVVALFTLYTVGATVNTCTQC